MMLSSDVFDPHCGARRFLRRLHEVDKQIPIERLRDPAGMTLLHVLVTHQRVKLLKVHIIRELITHNRVSLKIIALNLFDFLNAFYVISF